MLFERYIIGRQSTVKKTEQGQENVPFDKIEKQYLTFCRKIIYSVQLK